MGHIHSQLREIQREQKRRQNEARRQQRIAEKNLKIIRKRAQQAASQKLLGVERRRARSRALLWLGVSLLVLILAVNYLYHTIAKWWPSHTPLPK